MDKLEKKRLVVILSGGIELMGLTDEDLASPHLHLKEACIVNRRPITPKEIQIAVTPLKKQKEYKPDCVVVVGTASAIILEINELSDLYRQWQEASSGLVLAKKGIVQ